MGECFHCQYSRGSDSRETHAVVVAVVLKTELVLGGCGEALKELTCFACWKEKERVYWNLEFSSRRGIWTTWSNGLLMMMMRRTEEDSLIFFFSLLVSNFERISRVIKTGHYGSIRN